MKEAKEEREKLGRRWEEVRWGREERGREEASVGRKNEKRGGKEEGERTLRKKRQIGRKKK